MQHAPSLDFFAQIVGGEFLVRFKHLDDNLEARNYPTDQQSHLNRQEFSDRMVEQLAFDGFKRASYCSDRRLHLDSWRGQAESGCGDMPHTRAQILVLAFG